MFVGKPRHRRKGEEQLDQAPVKVWIDDSDRNAGLARIPCLEETLPERLHQGAMRLGSHRMQLAHRGFRLELFAQRETAHDVFANPRRKDSPLRLRSKPL